MFAREQRLFAGTALFSQLPVAVALQFGLLKDLALGGRQFGERRW